MVKGFIFFKGGKIPFVIEDYRMELFTDDDLLSDFCQTYNFKENYTLEGQYFRSGTQGQHADVPFKRITLYKDGWKKGWFYCPLVSEKSVSSYDGLFHESDVMKYVPKILNNIALDSGNKITRSIPLGHLGNSDILFSPQRFVEQVMAFEYLFDKLEHAKAQDKRFTLKNELEYMLNQFPKLLGDSHTASSDISNQIKEIRRNMAHGHAYYYDFKNDISAQRLILLLDKLIRNMSLLWIGFSKDEIDDYPVF